MTKKLPLAKRSNDSFLVFSFKLQVESGEYSGDFENGGQTGSSIGPTPTSDLGKILLRIL